MDTGSSRRRSDAGERMRDPVVQVVGFHVEGKAASPVVPSILDDSRTVGVGSPTPVIIPPSFLSQQRDLPKDSPLGWVPDDPAMILPMDGVDGIESELDGLGSTTTALLAPIVPVAKMVPAVAKPTPLEEPGSTQLMQGAYQSSASSEVSQASRITDLSAPPLTAMHGLDRLVSASKPPQHPPAPAASAPAVPPKPEGTQPKGKPPEGAEKPKLTRGERREIQEQQRAAKAAAKEGKDVGRPAGTGSEKPARAADTRSKEPKAAAEAPKRQPSSSGGGNIDISRSRSDSMSERRPESATSSAPNSASAHTPAAPAKKDKKERPTVSLGSTELFAHLQQYKKVSVDNLLSLQASNMHPAVVQLGLMYADGSISGANARCVALLHALCAVIRDYQTPEGKSLSRDLTQHLNSMIDFLVKCRPLSVSMGNAIKFIKLRISKIDPNAVEAVAKEELIQDVKEFISMRIEGADKLLVQAAVEKVDNDDLVMTYAYSHVVHAILSSAWRAGKRFRVLVVDARPELEGRIMLSKLVAEGVPCTYVFINALSCMIREVTKVFLGAAAVLSNGAVISRAGAAAVAMTAAANSKPVMICCESYKFHERVQLDSITHNELGDPAALATIPGQGDPHNSERTGAEGATRHGLLNLRYDTMPIDYVTMIVTEFGMIPPTSVPVIIREYRQEL